MITKCLYASDELIDDSSEIDIVNFIIGLFSEVIGEEEDRVVWRGNGTTEPTGIVTAQAAGAISGRTCSGNLSIDNMIDLTYDLPQKYSKNAKFYVHRTNIRELRKLKDANNRYYWSEPVAQGMLPTFLGYPVVETNELSEAQIYFGDLKQTYAKMCLSAVRLIAKTVNCWELQYGIISPYWAISSQAFAGMR